MIDRRAFAGLMASTFAFASSAWAQNAPKKTVFFASVGPVLTLYDVDLEAATLTARSSVTLPANVQYAWPHPSRRYFYVASSDGQPGGGDAPRGGTHRLNAFTIDSRSGALAPHGEARALPSRPIHVSVDQSGTYVLTAFNDPSSATVHRLNADGTLGQWSTGDPRRDLRPSNPAVPSNRTVIVIARGNNAPLRGGRPGLHHVFGFANGILSPLQSIAPGTGLGLAHAIVPSNQTLGLRLIERQNRSTSTISCRTDGSRRRPNS
jgi:hypothetical protein